MLTSIRRHGIGLLTVAVGLALVCFDANPAEQANGGWRATCKDIKKIHDGDTLTCVSDSHGSFVVRFAGIDAPETGQAYWRVARDRLNELAVPGTVAECYKSDQYGRQVCRLRAPDGKDLADAMIGEGLAWHAVQFAHEQTPEERSRYAELEQSAKGAKIGSWADTDPMPPRECRQLKARRLKCR